MWVQDFFFAERRLFLLSTLKEWLFVGFCQFSIHLTSIKEILKYPLSLPFHGPFHPNPPLKPTNSTEITKNIQVFHSRLSIYFLAFFLEAFFLESISTLFKSWLIFAFTLWETLGKLVGLVLLWGLEGIQVFLGAKFEFGHFLAVLDEKGWDYV